MTPKVEFLSEEELGSLPGLSDSELMELGIVRQPAKLYCPTCDSHTSTVPDFAGKFFYHLDCILCGDTLRSVQAKQIFVSIVEFDISDLEEFRIDELEVDDDRCWT